LFITVGQAFVEEFDIRGRKAAHQAFPISGGSPSSSKAIVIKRSSDFGPPITLYIKSDLRPSLEIRMRNRDTLGALKRRLAEIFERPPEMLAVYIFETRELHDDDKTFYGFFFLFLLLSTAI